MTAYAMPQSSRITSQEPLLGLAPLMRMAYSGVDLTPLGGQMLERAARNAGDNNALMDLSVILQLRGDPATALNLQHQALLTQQLYSLPPAGKKASIRLLALMAPGDLMANTPLEFLIEDTDIALDMLYISPDLPLPEVLPEHDVAIVAMSESDKNRASLQLAEELVKIWPRPVLNLPEKILPLSRDGVSEMLRFVPGVVVAQTQRLDRILLQEIARGDSAITNYLDDGDFPIIIRPVDSHAGHGLKKLDKPQDITGYLQHMPQSEFYVARFINYANEDGLFRKTRVAVIDGKPFVAHMAVSEHWMVHYLNAGMTESVIKRVEEARFMREFDQGFARRHARALHAITTKLGLDYYCIDCSETAQGELIVFEAGNAMVVHAIDPVDLFPYKPPQMQRVFAAFRNLLLHAALPSQPGALAVG